MDRLQTQIPKGMYAVGSADSATVSSFQLVCWRDWLGFLAISEPHSECSEPTEPMRACCWIFDQH